MKLKSEKEKEKMREWYKQNREHHIAKVQARQKANNYSSEKTSNQREIRYIKRRTRTLHPLVKGIFFKKREKCEFCGMFAKEHHHYTNPPEIHKFNFTCHDCHMEKDLEMDNHSKIQPTKLKMEVKKYDTSKKW